VPLPHAEYVRIHIVIYTYCIFVYIYTYIITYIDIHTCVYIYTDVCIYIYDLPTRTRIHKYTHIISIQYRTYLHWIDIVQTHIYSVIYIYVYTYIYIYICTYAHISNIHAFCDCLKPDPAFNQRLIDSLGWWYRAPQHQATSHPLSIPPEW